jgi:hypothetical protein
MMLTYSRDYYYFVAAIGDRGYTAFLSPIAVTSPSYRRSRLHRLPIADRGYVVFLSPIATASPSYRRSRP